MESLAGAFSEQSPWLQSLIGLVLLALAALLANFILKRVLLRMAAPFLDARSNTADKAAARLATIVPLLIVGYGIEHVPHLPLALVTVVKNVAAASIVVTVAVALAGALDYVNELYQRRPESKSRPIKGYVQVLKIAMFCGAAILVIATLMDRSPLLLLSGLGAMAAVLMLVFKDTILSLVASVQLSSNDMLRVGDWIEMPQFQADGDVIDIALHTVKVQNFDKTVTTIPTHRLISDSYRNWRGMQQAGGRRIKRAIYLDQNTLGFMTEEQLAGMERFQLLKPYLESKEAEIRAWNAAALPGDADAVNARRITNIGTFRAYILAYLKAHDRVHNHLMMLVRQLDPTPSGLPLEVYCFAKTTDWETYEAIQSDIFDHLLAILPEFGLRIFQEPSGRDLRALGARG
ncbi:mechanosensitive ion channel family protein [Stakelama tenebrarum]|uniref:Mechanosensing system component YbdG n=1 Tax=Stakelama tenebrarum TaxID=2711215 RepID=A0A6G6Y8V5_9SPHN|nr:mechanosensitive ion channel domain-containing protein [Sphingosinithalassobacter tenebrarum]QIG81349.1 mechanosensitive ion channel [Sphingosinithalassobacter tenebrarum]